MARGFGRSSEGRVALRLDDDEREVLASMLADLEQFVAPADADPDADPLAAMVGIETTAETPDDPALARLLPDAYPDDPAATSDFRRFTERSLREGKVANARTASASLQHAGGKIVLSREQAQAWLGALNDLRLAFGSRLGLSDENQDELRSLPDDDPRAMTFHVYDWLTWLQDSLLRALGAPDL